MTGEYITTLTKKGQVTIPGELRRALDLKPKDKIAFELAHGEVHLKPVRSRLLAGYGAVKPRAKPEDYSRMRQEVEEEWAEEVAKEA
ncbi:MAG: AbrB/MazE/SpoVT family DNA-binding domain-containing protein [Chloroflexi bacterium]|nr:AbrB/MazE/SpoVT family DNA-binding domain-containing protein [Chloroflexota bacterium]